MPFSVLKPEIQQFIQEHIGADLNKLALKKNPFPEVKLIDIINQIAAKTKAKDKLPNWFGTNNIVYPSKISVEQTSSEKTAKYKSGLISGHTIIDLTGGFGVDDWYFSKHFSQVIHCEINAELSAIARHNFEQMAVANIECIVGDSSETLKKLDMAFDWIYIDPSRRNDAKGKVFMLRDCLPNVPDLLDFYFTYAPKILIKTAPILDITAGLSELKHVAKIHIIAVENEVKELLWEISKGHNGNIEMATANLIKGTVETFGFRYQNTANATFSALKKYLYEPNAAIMKSGGFNEISSQFKLEKLHVHSHLYTSDTLMNFPGRVFEINQNIYYNKPEMKRWLENKKANITTRNFPETVENLRKKWKISDGGNDYCFFTTDVNNDKIVLICTKIK